MRTDQTLVFTVFALLAAGCSSAADRAAARQASALATVIEKIEPLHEKFGKPRPGDWVTQHHESGQTFDQYVRSRPVTPTGVRRIIYVQPLGDFTEKQRGVDVLTAQQDGMARSNDSELLDRATSLLRVLFSQDNDLLCEATKRQEQGVAFATAQQIILLPQSISNLNRYANSPVPAEVEHQNRMTHPGRTPIEKEQVDTVQVIEIVRSSVVVWRIVVSRAVLGVADVLDCNQIAVSMDLCQDSRIGLPLPLV